jgi:hypothetical protein
MVVISGGLLKSTSTVALIGNTYHWRHSRIHQPKEQTTWTSHPSMWYCSARFVICEVAYNLCLYNWLSILLSPDHRRPRSCMGSTQVHRTCSSGWAHCTRATTGEYVFMVPVANHWFLLPVLPETRGRGWPRSVGIRRTLTPQDCPSRTVANNRCRCVRQRRPRDLQSGQVPWEKWRVRGSSFFSLSFFFFFNKKGNVELLIVL